LRLETTGYRWQGISRRRAAARECRFHRKGAEDAEEEVSEDENSGPDAYGILTDKILIAFLSGHRPQARGQDRLKARGYRLEVGRDPASTRGGKQCRLHRKGAEDAEEEVSEDENSGPDACGILTDKILIAFLCGHRPKARGQRLETFTR